MSSRRNLNEWEKRFGAARRASDKALLEEVERQTSIDEAAALAFETVCHAEANRRDQINPADDGSWHGGRY